MGCAVLALDTEMVVGADIADGVYDGKYVWNAQKGEFDVDMRVEVPEGTTIVQGVTAPPGGLTFNVTCSFPRNPDNEVILAMTDHGPVYVRIKLLRAFD